MSDRRPIVLESPFAIGDRVIIDGHDDMVAFVTGIVWRGTTTEAECSWIHAGAAHQVWMPMFRLTAAQP